jgi:ribonuclease HI
MVKKMRYTFILDASYDYKTNIAGVGIVIHESNNPKKNKNGIVINEISESYIGIPSGMIEMLAVYRALEIAVDKGYKKGLFEPLHSQFLNTYKWGSLFQHHYG